MAPQRGLWPQPNFFVLVLVLVIVVPKAFDYDYAHEQEQEKSSPRDKKSTVSSAENAETNGTVSPTFRFRRFTLRSPFFPRRSLRPLRLQRSTSGNLYPIRVCFICRSPSGRLIAIQQPCQMGPP